MPRFNPPPGWPAFPEGWTPPTGWQADPEWPAPPDGWQWWLADPPQHWWSWREVPAERKGTSLRGVPIGTISGARPGVPDHGALLGWLINATGIVVIVGSLLPWFTVLDLPIAGVRGDGLITLIAGALLVLGGAGVALARRRWVALVSLFLAVIATGISGYDMIKGRSALSGSAGLASMGLGLWVTLAGGVLAVVVTASAMVRLGADIPSPAGLMNPTLLKRI